MANDYKLYGAPLSLYTGKVRAYLKNKQIPYEEVFSSLKVYKNIIVPNTGVRFIPIVETPEGEYLQDTAAIIDRLETDFPFRPVVPSTPKQKMISYLFEAWADEWLLIPAMHYRWNKDNFPFIYQEFGRIVLPGMPKFIRGFVGKKVGAKFKGFVPILGITDKSIPAIESWYESHVLPLLDKHFASHDYLLGATPSLGDFCLMGPLYAHLYRDPEPGQLMRQKAPHLARWVERMNTPPAEQGGLLGDDQVPETLFPLLTRMFEEFWPVLTSTVQKLNDWKLQNPEQNDVPRTIGNHDFVLGGVTESRAIMTFHQWKLQRVLNCFNGFGEEDKQSVIDCVSEFTDAKVLNIAIQNPVTRINNKLAFE